MFYYISGKVAHTGIDFLVIDCGGVGYKINTSEPCVRRVSVGDDVKVYTYLHVREDIFDLYGFLSDEELNLFKMLISVSGVGPKVGLGILSSVTPSDFALAVVTGNVKAITKAQGVGPKVAQRIILELKDKMKNAEVSEMPEDYESFSDNTSEAVSALMVLGYSRAESQRAVAKAGFEGGLEETIKRALKIFMK